MHDDVEPERQRGEIGLYWRAVGGKVRVRAGEQFLQEQHEENTYCIGMLLQGLNDTRELQGCDDTGEFHLRQGVITLLQF